jgi:hypothetical protein
MTAVLPGAGEDCGEKYAAARLASGSGGSGTAGALVIHRGTGAGKACGNTGASQRRRCHISGHVAVAPAREGPVFARLCSQPATVYEPYALLRIPTQVPE